MKELNLKVGQKVWSIQLGDCFVKEMDDSNKYIYILQNKEGNWHSYDKFGKHGHIDCYPSLFLSNPFENQSVKPNEMVENKAELINALCRVRESFVNGQILNDVETKLQKLIESL
jgi:hypothetical protein